MKKFYLCGLHPVIAALNNVKRKTYTLLATKEAQTKLPNYRQMRTVTTAELDKTLGPNQVHQGCAIEVDPLPRVFIEDLTFEHPRNLIIALDQVTDPHNVGAILRSAAAFGACAVILPENNAPDRNSPTIAKSACGATEFVPLIYVTNLVRALEYLKSQGFWIAGLDERGEQTIAQMKFHENSVIVFGSEGQGLRQLTKKTCDYMVRLPTNPEFPTINVSNAVAVTLYAATNINQ